MYIVKTSRYEWLHASARPRFQFREERCTYVHSNSMHPHVSDM